MTRHNRGEFCDVVSRVLCSRFGLSSKVVLSNRLSWIYPVPRLRLFLLALVQENNGIRDPATARVAFSARENRRKPEQDTSQKILGELNLPV